MREAKRMKKHYASFADDYDALVADIKANPLLGTDLGGGVRKVRMRITSKGKGKSGGARVITFNVIIAATDTEVNLLYIYDKAERSTITAAEIGSLLRQNGMK